MELLDEDYVITEATELEGSIYDETALKKYVVTIIPKGEKEGTVIKRGSEDIGMYFDKAISMEEKSENGNKAIF